MVDVVTIRRWMVVGDVAGGFLLPVRTMLAERNLGVGSKAFVLLRRASYFLLRGQEKGNQREGHPASAPCGRPARKVRVRAAGFVDRASCPDAKLVGIPADHPSGCSSTHPPLQRGSGRATRILRALFSKATSTALHFDLRRLPGCCVVAQLHKSKPKTREPERRVRLRPSFNAFSAGSTGERVAVRGKLSLLFDPALGHRKRTRPRCRPDESRRQGYAAFAPQRADSASHANATTCGMGLLPVR